MRLAKRDEQPVDVARRCWYAVVLGPKAKYRSGPSRNAYMGAPPLSDTYDNAKGKADIVAVLTTDTVENKAFVARLDDAADELLKLQKANVAVLWTSLHEARPDGWFWRSKGTGAQYVALWKSMYEYFTNTKGLNNLVWLMPFSGSVSSAFYPGRDYVDIAGPDTYDKVNQPLASLYSRSVGIIGSVVPIPLHETGAIPDPKQMFPNAAPWVLFNVWCDYRTNVEFNPEGRIQATYASAYTITRDEVPNLK